MNTLRSTDAALCILFLIFKFIFKRSMPVNVNKPWYCNRIISKNLKRNVENKYLFKRFRFKIFFSVFLIKITADDLNIQVCKNGKRRAHLQVDLYILYKSVSGSVFNQVTFVEMDTYVPLFLISIKIRTLKEMMVYSDKPNILQL